MKNRPEITERFLTPNRYTRPQRDLKNVEALVVHWVGLPEGTNGGLFKWFNEIAPRDGRYGSTHYGIDDDSIVQFIPLTEMAYHVGAKEYSDWKESFFGDRYPNAHTIGVELNHINWTGQFSEKVLDKAVDLFAWLCRTYELDPMNRIVRHHDITGKDCPRYFVNVPDQFYEFKTRVRDAL